jgi:hypothetical protein
VNWEQAQELARLMEVVTLESRRSTLEVLLRADGFRLTRAVPNSQLFDLNKLAEFVRLYSRRIE